ncbi:MAG: hypothetical protein FWB73_00100 [Treponema sp.]|nr:hypothetical protein [Treponema sp.]
MIKKGDKFAFPRPIGHTHNIGCSYNEAQNGMTLRDYFAAKAMTAIIIPPKTCEDFNNLSADPDYLIAFAKTAYLIADAMIKERGKENISNG